MDDEEEAKERREAELLFVESAYTQDEIDIVLCQEPNASKIESSNDLDKTLATVAAIVKRKLRLPLNNDASVPDQNDDSGHEHSSAFLFVQLVVSIPKAYPCSIKEGELLEVTASVVDDSIIYDCGGSTSKNVSGHYRRNVRKTAINLLPSLLDVCRIEIQQSAGSETIFNVFNAADEWIQDTWKKQIQMNTCISPIQEGEEVVREEDGTKEIWLGRRVIYSHHIKSKIKRRDMIDLASDYELGGIMKIGWPGIIILEGSEENCKAFLKHINGNGNI